MQFARSFVTHSYRRGKPHGRHSFNNEAKGMANRTPPEKPVAPRGPMAPGLALFFGFTGYIIWQMVELRGISKAADKDMEYRREIHLRNTRIGEGQREISRLMDKNEAEAEAKANN